MCYIFVFVHLFYIIKAVSFLVSIGFHCYFWTFYRWQCDMDFAHCWRPYGDLQLLISVSFCGHVVSLGFIPQLLFYMYHYWTHTYRYLGSSILIVCIYIYTRTHPWYHGSVIELKYMRKPYFSISIVMPIIRYTVFLCFQVFLFEPVELKLINYWLY